MTDTHLHAPSSVAGREVRTDVGGEGGLCLVDGSRFAATTAGSLYRLSPKDRRALWQEWRVSLAVPILAAQCCQGMRCLSPTAKE